MRFQTEDKESIPLSGYNDTLVQRYFACRRQERAMMHGCMSIYFPEDGISYETQLNPRIRIEAAFCVTLTKSKTGHRLIVIVQARLLDVTIEADRAA